MTPPSFGKAFVATVCALSLQVVRAQSELAAVTITGNYDNAVGTSDAASQGVVTAKLLASRPTLRPAEVLEFVPGVIVSQHSGDGKANQYYLRGFNLDHGTDFATTVDGMPVNMPTHAHGQGYSDLNWLIPELVDTIRYRKGPYAAEEGDFSSAGSAHIGLVNKLPQGLASLTLGAHAYERLLLTDSPTVGQGKLLYALEAAHNNGPWEQPERFTRYNGVLRYALGEGAVKQTLTAMAYTAQWRATDQVPQRAVDAGLIGRFGAIDPTDHGQTSRQSLSYAYQQSLDDGGFKLNAYAIRSQLDLFSNFTFFLDNPGQGDQFEQSEKRQVLGLNASRNWLLNWLGLDMSNTLGMQARQDRLSPVGLYSAQGGVRTGVTQESRVHEASVGVYFENDTRWSPWLRTLAGLRADQYRFAVNSSIAANSGAQGAFIASPKLSLVMGPWRQTELFYNAGEGFHSNDARGVTARVTAKDGLPIDPAAPLVRTKGQELGLRTELVPGLQTSLALWQLKLDSELVFVGDAGETQASGASRRHGIEVNNHYAVSPKLLLDADVSFSQARFTQDQGNAPNVGRSVPGSVRSVASLGVTLTDQGPWSGHLQWRYFGPRPLLEDNSQRSQGTTLAYARVGYQFSRSTKVAVDVFNLFNRRASDIDYFYTSRLPGEPVGGVADLHSHPAEPRSLRVTLSQAF